MKKIKVEINFTVKDNAVKRSWEIWNECSTEFCNRLQEEKLAFPDTLYSSNLRIVENNIADTNNLV